MIQKLFSFFDKYFDPVPYDIDVTTFELLERRQKRKESVYIMLLNLFMAGLFGSIFAFYGYITLTLFAGVLAIFDFICLCFCVLIVDRTDDLIYLKRMLEEKGR